MGRDVLIITSDLPQIHEVNSFAFTFCPREGHRQMMEETYNDSFKGEQEQKSPREDLRQMGRHGKGWWQCRMAGTFRSECPKEQVAKTAIPELWKLSSNKAILYT